MEQNQNDFKQLYLEFDQTMAQQFSNQRSFMQVISSFFNQKNKDKNLRLAIISLKNKELKPEFITDNSDDFGIKSQRGRQFHEEVISYLRENTKIDDVIGQQNGQKDLKNNLKMLVEILLEKLGHDPYQTNVVQHILADRSFDRMYIDNSLTKPVFQKFKKILKECRSYQEWKEYNGVDINILKNKVKQEILNVLNELNLHIDLHETICQKLIENPLSTIVSNHKQLTNNQKKRFHQSRLYVDNILRNYAHVLFFKESRLFKAREEISQIVDLIQRSNIRIFDEMVNHLHSYRLQELLKIIEASHLKKIYKFITQKKTYFDICLKLADIKKYQSQKEEKQFIDSLEGNIEVNAILDLRIYLLTLSLPFEEWESTELQLFKSNQKRIPRSYHYISQLNLKNMSKIILLKKIYESIEPIFHSFQRPICYRSRIQWKLFGLILQNDNTFNIRLSSIIELINETLQNRHSHYGSQASNLRPKQKAAYDEKILRDEDLVTYIRNGGNDIEDEKYQKKNKIRNIIYQNHQERDIDWPYKEIEAFIEDLVERNQTNLDYVDRYKRVIGERLQQFLGNNVIVQAIVSEGAIQAEETEERVQQRQDYRVEFNELSETIVSTYFAKIEQCKLQAVLKDVYNNNRPRMIKDIITLDAYQNDKSKFYDKITASSLVKKKTMKQMQRVFTSFLASQIQKARDLLRKIDEQQHSRQNIQSNGNNSRNLEALQENFKAEAIKFLQEYFNKFEDSKLQLLFSNRYERNAVNLVKDLIENEAFTDPLFRYVESLTDQSGIIRAKIKKEFAANSAYCIEKLSKCIAILADMR